jgi:hypothetical protein
MSKINLFACLLIFAVSFFACKDNKEEPDNNQTTEGVLGDVGNSWKVKVNGTNDISAKITSREGDVRTVEMTYAKLITKTVKFGFNGNEVIDYAYSKGDLSKPFTMVKFNANIGDTYTAEIDGVYHYRQVVEKQSYFIPSLNKELETIGVSETIPYEVPSSFFGVTIRTIIWYWHPQYGLVCADVYTDQGDYFEIEFISIEL